jgi:hypothetical protein
MKNRFHGLLSISLILAASMTGMTAISRESWLLAVIYLGIIVASWMAVIGTFCVKCPCRLDSCAHVFPGKITKIFPAKKPGSYSLKDMIITALALALIFTYPQYWLWKEKNLFITFWLMIIIALAEIYLFVCRGCSNRYCPNFRDTH